MQEMRCQEAADFLGIALFTLYGYMHKGLIKSTKRKDTSRGKGTITFFTREDLIEFKNLQYGEKKTNTPKVFKPKTPLELMLSKLVGKQFLHNMKYLKITGYELTDNTVIIVTNKSNYCFLKENIKEDLEEFLPIEK